MMYKSFVIIVLWLFLSGFGYNGPRGLYVLEYPVDMPNVSLINEKNDKVSILENPAELTIFIFWSQSCYPCLHEMRGVESFYQKAKKDNIRVALVSPHKGWKNSEQQRAFLVKYGAPSVPFYNDEGNQLSLKLGIGSTPYTVIMNKEGKKVATIQGEVNWSAEKLYNKIKGLIK